MRVVAALATTAIAVLAVSPAAPAVPAPVPCPPPASAAVSAATPVLLPAPGKPALPAPPPSAPGQVIVCIGAHAITGEAVAHWSDVARRSGGRRASDASIAQQALSFLISSDWVLGEAEALGIGVTETDVRHSFDRIRAQQFRKRREFQKFLRSSGQTVADLLFRVRLNVTSERIQRHFTSGHASAKAKERALARFVVEFKRRWTAKTYCVAAYAIVDCGSVF